MRHLKSARHRQIKSCQSGVGESARHSAPMDGVITSDNKILRIAQNILRPHQGMGIKNPPASAAGRGEKWASQTRRLKPGAGY